MKCLFSIPLTQHYYTPAETDLLEKEKWCLEGDVDKDWFALGFSRYIKFRDSGKWRTANGHYTVYLAKKWRTGYSMDYYDGEWHFIGLGFIHLSWFV